MVAITRIRGINILNSKIDKNVELDVQGFHLPVKVDEILCYSYISDVLHLYIGRVASIYRMYSIYISDMQYLYIQRHPYIDTKKSRLKAGHSIFSV